MAFMLNCKEVHRLTSEAMDRELTLVERTRLRAHVMICDACYTFNGQMQLLRKAMHKLGEVDPDDESPKEAPKGPPGK